MSPRSDWVGFGRRLDLIVPIVLAPMGGGPSTPELIAAVANRGGLGSIAAGYLTPTALEAALADCRRLTEGALAVNIFVPASQAPSSTLGQTAAAALDRISQQLGAPPPSTTAPDPSIFDAHVEIAAESDAALVSFTFGLPPATAIGRLQEAGKVVAATANTFREAELVAQSGCDAVILQGFEAAAHRGGLSDHGDRHVGLLALLEQARSLEVDVIASGGITSGAGIAACLALGAAAVQIGTAFLVTDESGATPEWKKAVATSDDAETTVTAAITGRGARAVPNRLVEELGEVDPGEIPDYPIMNGYTSSLRQRARELGDPEYQSLWGGQAGAATRAGSAAELIVRLTDELDAARRALADSGRQHRDGRPDL